MLRPVGIKRKESLLICVQYLQFTEHIVGMAWQLFRTKIIT